MSGKDMKFDEYCIVAALYLKSMSRDRDVETETTTQFRTAWYVDSDSCVIAACTETVGRV